MKQVKGEEEEEGEQLNSTISFSSILSSSSHLISSILLPYQLITWSHPIQSTYLLFIHTFLSIYNSTTTLSSSFNLIILAIINSSIIVKLFHHHHHHLQQHHQQQHDINQSLQAIQDLIHQFNTLSNILSQPDHLFHRAIISPSSSNPYRLCLSCILTLQFVHHLEPSYQHRFYFLIRTIFITWHSPWLCRLRSSLFSLLATNPSDEKLSDPKNSKDLVENSFLIRFTLIEHQRWRQDSGWSSKLATDDHVYVPSTWTDSLNREARPPGMFKLPGPYESDHYSNHPSKIARNRVRRRVVKWEWLDSDWSILKPKMTTAHRVDRPHPHSHPAVNPQTPASESTNSRKSQDPIDSPSFALDDHHDLDRFDLLRLDGSDSPWKVDSHGWTYGNNRWEDFDRFGRFDKFTRKRAWIRRANRMMISTIIPVTHP